MKLMHALSLSVAAVAAISVQTAHAGTYVEEIHTVSTGGQSQAVTVKTWVEGDVVRTDDPRTGQVLLLNTKKNSIMGVDKAAKEWWRMKDEDLKMFGMATLAAYGIKMDPATGKLTVPEKIFEKTGQSKKVGDWDAYEVKIKTDTTGTQAQGGSIKSIMWFAKVPGYDPAIPRARMRVFMGEGAEAEAFMKQWDALDGVPVITEMEISMQGQNIAMKQELKKVAPQKLGQDQLTVPKGFKQGKDPIQKMKEAMAKQQGGGGMAPPPMGGNNAPPPIK